MRLECIYSYSLPFYLPCQFVYDFQVRTYDLGSLTIYCADFCVYFFDFEGGI